MGIVKKSFITEVFFSFQGEGILIGTPMIFVRFAGCSFGCRYCDTLIRNKKYLLVKDGINKKIIERYKNPVDCKALCDIIEKIADFGKCEKWISITGGEPLEQVDFLYKFLESIKKRNYKIYLETNGIYYKALQKIYKYINVISMDLKIPSSTGKREVWEEHRKFIDIALKNKMKIFYKITVNNHLTKNECEKIKYLIGDNEIVVQPVINSKKLLKNLKKIIKYNRVKVIPQVHKVLDVL